MSAWFYILRVKSSQLYCGSTHNLENRVKAHFDGRACRTTAIDPPRNLVYSEEFAAYKEAYRRGQQVKRWTRAKKEALVAEELHGLKDLCCSRIDAARQCESS